MVMKNGSSAGYAPNKLNAFLLGIGVITLLKRILVFSNDYGGFVDVKQQIVVGGIQIPQTILFQCQVHARIGDDVVFN